MMELIDSRDDLQRFGEYLFAFRQRHGDNPLLHKIRQGDS